MSRTRRQDPQPTQCDPGAQPARITQARLEEMFAQIAQLTNQVDTLQSTVDHMVDTRGQNLRLSEYLPQSLAELIGWEIQQVSVNGSTKQVFFELATVTINPFDEGSVAFHARRIELEPLEVVFQSDGRLSTDSLRLIRGFVTEVQSGGTVGTDFWYGSADTTGAIRATQAGSTPTAGLTDDPHYDVHMSDDMGGTPPGGATN